MTQWGVVIAQLRQWWRRGEYAPAIRFYEDAGIPIKAMVTAAALEGGDVLIVEPGRVLIGNGEGRTQEPAARQLAAWFEEEGWEARVEQFPEQYVHIDVLVSVLAERLAAVCVEVVSPSLVTWLREIGFELIEVSAEDASHLGANAISLGDGRVMSGAGAEVLNEAIRAQGLELLDPELDSFTLGGGGAHCLAQALRRERVE
jgi:N-dimethylarginine dimethylaminohydrolase